MIRRIFTLTMFCLLTTGGYAQTNNAYGNNQKEVSPGVFAIYSGDINQDGVIDIIDQVVLDNDLYNTNTGYVNTDLNGDSVVDIIDQVILDNNIYNSVGVFSPANGNRVLQRKTRAQAVNSSQNN